MSDNAPTASYALIGLAIVTSVVGLATVGYLLGPAPQVKEKKKKEKSPFDSDDEEGGLDEDTIAFIHELMAAQGGGSSPKKKNKSPWNTKPLKLPPTGPPKSLGLGSAYPDVSEYTEEDRMHIKLNQQVQAIFAAYEESKEDAKELVKPCLQTAMDCFGEAGDPVVSLAVRFSKLFEDPSYLQWVFDQVLDAKKDNFKMLWTIGILLSEMYDGDDGFVEDMDQVISNNERLMEVLLKAPDKYREPYLLLAEQTLSLYRNLGFWKKISEFVLEVRSHFAHHPLSLRSIVEQQVGSLHQEGKTEAAIAYLNSYLELIKTVPNSNMQIVWCHQRMSKFEFYMDNFSNSCKHLITAFEFREKNSVDVYGILSDLISVYVELGEDAKAEETFKLLKHEKHMAELVRSKYLLTTSATLDNKFYIYLKVCRVRPHRVEGEKDLEENEYERKLDTFFIEVTYPHPHGEEPIVVEEAVDHHDIELTSPVFSPAATPGTWHLVKINIYQDGSKSVLLGRHWQPVFATRTQGRRQRNKLHL